MNSVYKICLFSLKAFLCFSDKNVAQTACFHQMGLNLLESNLCPHVSPQIFLKVAEDSGVDQVAELSGETY